MSNFTNLLGIEVGAHEGIGILEKGLFHSDYDLLETSAPFATNTREGTHSEEIVVISGSIQIAP